MTRNKMNQVIKKPLAFAYKHKSKSIVVMFMVIGIVTLLVSHAATNAVSLQPESGSVSGGSASVVSPAGASGSAVKFAKAVTQPPSGNFAISGAKIISPDGTEFVPVGANVNGPHSFWNDPTIGNAALAKKWGWNTIRLTTCLPGGCFINGSQPYDYSTNNDLDGITSQYANQKIVTMIELHHFAAGGIPNTAQMAQAVTWWKDIANKYKNNSYVWFNLINEPGDVNTSLNEWNSVTDTLATAIRSTGAQNIIVADGAYFGQDSRDWACNANIPYANSGIINKGPALESKHGNILFSLHEYSWWGAAGNSCPDATLDARLTNYVNAVRAKSIPLVVGEFSYPENIQGTELTGYAQAANATFRVAPGLKLGLLFWHGSTWENSALTNGSGSWVDMNSGASNLTPTGRKLYDFARLVNPSAP